MNHPTTTDCRQHRYRSRVVAVCVDERGLGEATQIMVLAVVVVAFVMVLTLAGRGAEARNRTDHAAESAAQAAALQRTPDNAVQAATAVADAALTNCASGRPDVAVDTSSWAPGALVSVTITCRIATGDLAPLPLPGSLTMTSRSAAVIDTFRASP